MAFQLCLRLEHISFPYEIEEIPMGLFSFCNALKEVQIPDNIKHIADNAFMCCTNLKDIDLPESIETIGKDAFCGCALEMIVLPRNLKVLGDGSFLIENLDTVYCKSATPPLCENSHYGPFAEDWISNTILYVPIGSKDLYKYQWEWYLFKDIIETDNFPSAGIDDVLTNQMDKDDTVYDLSDRKVEPLISGNIYIRGGKKFISR